MSSIKHKISPCLWIEKDARKAVEYYQSIFKDTALVSYKEYKKKLDEETANAIKMDL